MRFALVCIAIAAGVAGCSSDEIPPLQAAVVASSTSTTEAPTTTVDLTAIIGDAEAATPQTPTSLPAGFSIDDRTCYQHDTGETLTTALLYISANGDSLVGGIELGDRAGFTYQAVAGARRGTSFSVNVSAIADTTVENEDWFFEPFGVLLPQQVVLDTIDCDTVVEAAIAIETEVTRFPEAP